ncbi:alpha/beta hydrolase [Clostridium sp.]|uniref:alpha/beta hydrolase n=1 Tax=Clostridium sp. TaxID=1506 RepID=UPI002FC59E14
MVENIIFAAKVIIAIALIVLIFAGNYFYNFGVLRRKKEFLKGNPDLENDDYAKDWADSRVWFDGKTWEDITMKSYDNLTLFAKYLKAPKDTDKIAILVHGYSGKGSGMAFIAQHYHETLGYNVLMPDLRGHGQSEGNYIGFGWHDRKDLIKWINYVIESHGENSQIILHGISMGAATVLMTSGEELPSNVMCSISDCAYTSAKDILIFQMKKMFKIPSFPLIQVTSLICKLRAGYCFGEASAVKQVEKTKKPILFIHGSEDKFVPTKMVYPLYEASTMEKELFIVPKAGHGYAYWVDKKGYESEMMKFMSRYIK